MESEYHDFIAQRTGTLLFGVPHIDVSDYIVAFHARPSIAIPTRLSEKRGM
jgi:hypothetical protein